MKHLTYTFPDLIKREGWGPGPWDGECDKIQWLDQRTQLPCLLCRSPVSGGWCGYVGVSKGHPLFEKPYIEIEADLDVHGGLTFTDHCHEGGRICHLVEEGEDDNVWWLGFDCNHALDRAPGLEAVLRKSDPVLGPTLWPDPAAHYWTMLEVRTEVENLARQLKEMA